MSTSTWTNIHHDINTSTFATAALKQFRCLNDVLSAEQNQGFIVVHELINAAYPDFTVVQKLDIGEALIEAKIFRHGTDDFNYRLFKVDSSFIKLLPVKEDFLNLMDELIAYERDEKKIAHFKLLKKVAETYAYSSDDISNIFVKELSAIPYMSDWTSISQYIGKIYNVLVDLGYTFQNGLITFDSLKIISSRFKIPLRDLSNITDPIKKRNFQGDFFAFLKTDIGPQILLNFESVLVSVLEEQSSYALLGQYAEYLFNPKGSSLIHDSLFDLSKRISDNQYSIKFEWTNYSELGILEEVTPLLEKAYYSVLAAKGYLVDIARTQKYSEWIKKFEQGISIYSFESIFSEDDNIIAFGEYFKQHKFKVSGLNVSKKMLIVRNEKNKKVTYSFPHWRDAGEYYSMGIRESKSLVPVLFLK